MSWQGTLLVNPGSIFFVPGQKLDCDLLFAAFEINYSTKYKIGIFPQCSAILTDFKKSFLIRLYVSFSYVNLSSKPSFLCGLLAFMVVKHCCRDARRLVLSVQTVTPPQIMPSCINLGDDVSCNVDYVLTSQCDVDRLHRALKNVFDDKYQVYISVCAVP